LAGTGEGATKAVHGPATALTLAEPIRAYAEDELLIRRNRDARCVMNVRRLLPSHVGPHVGHHRVIDLGYVDLSRLFTILMRTTSAKAKE
jgi:hypothetical protein